MHYVTMRLKNRHRNSTHRIIRILVAAVVFLTALHTEGSLAVFTRSSDTLKEKISALNRELRILPKGIPSATPSTMGYRSKPLRSSDEPLQIDVVFPEPALIDLLVLMPTAYSDDGYNLKEFGFPVRFLLERILPDGTTEPVADFRDRDYTILGIEPQFFPCPSTAPTRGIRLTVKRAATYHSGAKAEHVVAIGELFAFSGEHNVALNAEVKTPNYKFNRNLWTPQCLTDGFFLFSPVNRHHEAQYGDYRIHADQVVLNYDLGEVKAIDEFRLWPAVFPVGYGIPFDSGINFPTKIRLEKLDRPNDPHPQLLFKSRPRIPRPGSTPFFNRIPQIKGRYFRLTLAEGFPEIRTQRESNIALSEIELLSKGEVISQGIIPQISETNLRKKVFTPLHLLTDGRTGEGLIISPRQWLEQFHREQELIRKRKILKTDLELALRQEKERVGMLIIAALALIVFLVLVIWIVRLLAAKHWAKMREQIAADLHDEVGANLSSIAHATELIQELMPALDATQRNLLESATLTARMTARDTRQFIKILEQRQTNHDVEIHIRRIARQILGTIPHQCILKEIEHFNQLPPIRQWNFFLFLKETLNNVIKHAGASHVQISTHKDGSRLQLIVEDNGCGIPSTNLPLHHLEQRTKQVKGKMDVYSRPENGTKITLTLRTKR